MIKYLGAKRKLIKHIIEVLNHFPEFETFADVFAGTSVVGRAMKKQGYSVVSNDYSAYGHCISRCYVEANRRDYLKEATSLVREFNKLKGIEGFITHNYCDTARFFQRKNGLKIDAVRQAIEDKQLSPMLESVMVTSLIRAAEQVDSTCGVQQGFVKSWSIRSHNDMRLVVPEMIDSIQPCKSYQMDANEFVRLEETACDVVYLDPPYNNLNYRNSYHIWETLTLNDSPEVYGVVNKRIDIRTIKSNYNSKIKFKSTFVDLLAGISTKLLILSFSNEGFITKSEFISLLATKGQVFVKEVRHKRYIGYYNGGNSQTSGNARVSAPAHTHAKEYFYFVSKDPKIIRTLTRLGLQSF